MEVNLREGLFTEKSPSLLSWQKQTAYGDRQAYQFRYCLPNQSPVISDILKYWTVSTFITWEVSVLRTESVVINSVSCSPP